ncbi:hypothetical protein VP01_333g11 [Puccinia sorghi]|uniref:Uncharacterized protein n=1 Tax=Puccinia sorghi TaxID=27349 RepID=A0A0L6UZ10_9BASI|nr:hypothetical protein VP01_333g11 [Puccinia sorghi]
MNIETRICETKGPQILFLTKMKELLTLANPTPAQKAQPNPMLLWKSYPMTMDQSSHSRHGKHFHVLVAPPWGFFGVKKLFVGGNKFCSWCNVIKDNTSELKIGPPRHGANIQRISNNWLTMASHTRCTCYDSQLDGRSSYAPLPCRGGDPGFTAAGGEAESDKSNSSTSDDDYKLNQGGSGGLFSEREMDYFCSTLKNVVLPSIVGCIPMVRSVCICHSAYCFRDLCQKHQRHQNSFKLMVNNGENFIATHGDCFKSVYEKYNQSSIKIFENLKLNPNHHYTLHVLEQLMIWGPMGGVAQWSGERFIGKLRGMETNKQLGE